MTNVKFSQTKKAEKYMFSVFLLLI